MRPREWWYLYEAHEEQQRAQGGKSRGMTKAEADDWQEWYEKVTADDPA